MKFRYLALTIVVLSIFACSNNKFDVDVSDIEVNLDIKRLDLDLMKNYPDTPDVYMLMEKYGSFMDLYGYQVLRIGGTNQSNFTELLFDKAENYHDYRIPAKVENKFGDFSKHEKELEQAFKYYKYYFPTKQIPKIYIYFSDFSQSIVIDSALIGVGIDKYLGADYELYPRIGFDRYKIRRMHPRMLVVDCMRALAISEFEYSDAIDNMLSQMVHEGKIQYFLDVMLPFTPDSLKFGYTKNQFDWAEHNEDKMWAYLVENKLLFSTDVTEIRKMIGDGPFTTLFANNSAPRAGAFLGWKIVYSYMKNNPKVGLPELMKNVDYQGILNGARYKP